MVNRGRKWINLLLATPATPQTPSWLVGVRGLVTPGRDEKVSSLDWNSHWRVALAETSHPANWREGRGWGDSSLLRIIGPVGNIRGKSMLISSSRGYQGCVSHTGVIRHSSWVFCSLSWDRHRPTRLNGGNANPLSETNPERRRLLLLPPGPVSNSQTLVIDLWVGLQTSSSLGDPTDCWDRQKLLGLVSSRTSLCPPWIPGLLHDLKCRECAEQRDIFFSEGTTARSRTLD